MKPEEIQVQEGQPNYVERLATNIPWCAQENGLSMRRVAGMADISFTTLRNWMRGDGSPTLTKLAAVGDAVGVDATDLLLDHSELVAKVKRVGFRPFVLRPGANPNSSSFSLSSSGATADRSHFRQKAKPRSKRERNARFIHTRPSQGFPTSRRRNVCAQRAWSTHAARPARTPVPVDETVVLSR